MEAAAPTAPPVAPPEPQDSGDSSFTQSRAGAADSCGCLTWTQQTPVIAEMLDTISIDLLISSRAATSSRPLRPGRQTRIFAEVQQHILDLVAQALDLRREAARAVAAGQGAGAERSRTAELACTRAFELLWLLPSLAFGRQPSGDGVGPAARLSALQKGTFTAQLQAVIISYKAQQGIVENAQTDSPRTRSLACAVRP